MLYKNTSNASNPGFFQQLVYCLVDLFQAFIFIFLLQIILRKIVRVLLGRGRGNTANGLVHGSVPLPQHIRRNHSCVKDLARLKAEVRAERTNDSEAIRLLIHALETAIKDPANLSQPCRICCEISPVVNIITERMRDRERVGCSIDRLCYELLMSLELPPAMHRKEDSISSTRAPPSQSQLSGELASASIFRSASNVQIGEASFTNVNSNSETSIVNNTFVVGKLT